MFVLVGVLLLVVGVLLVLGVLLVVGGGGSLLDKLCSTLLLSSCVEQTDSLLANFLTITLLPSPLHARITGVPWGNVELVQDREVAWSLDRDTVEVDTLESAFSGIGDDTDLDKHVFVASSGSISLSLVSSFFLLLEVTQSLPDAQTSGGSAIP